MGTLLPPPPPLKTQKQCHKGKENEQGGGLTEIFASRDAVMKDYLNDKNKLEESRLALERDYFAAKVRLKGGDQESQIKR